MMTRVIRVISNDPPLLRVEDEDIGAPGPGEVLVHMLLMPVHPADILQMRGQYGDHPDLPYVPGFEGVGRVAEVGEGVSRLKVGDIVLPNLRGTWRDAAVVPERGLIVLPREVDLAQAAMFKASPASALVMLTKMVDLPKGAEVLFNAANSAVGQNLIRMARELGLRSVAQVRSQAAADQIADLAPDMILIGDDQPPRALTAPLALDAIGGKATAAMARLLPDGATIVTYGLLSGEAPRIDALDLVFRDIRLRGFWLAREFKTMPAKDIQQVFATLADYLPRGLIHSRVGRIIPFDKVDQLIALHDSPRDGKLLLATRHYSAD